MNLFHEHDWMDLNDGAARTCVACKRIELRDGDGWRKLEGVTAGNWHVLVKRICLDGCDSLAEHRAKLGA
jgi:hypothetical protein